MLVSGGFGSRQRDEDKKGKQKGKGKFVRGPLRRRGKGRHLENWGPTSRGGAGVGAVTFAENNGDQKAVRNKGKTINIDFTERNKTYGAGKA